MTREITTISLKLIFVTHLFDKLNFTVNICKHAYIRLDLRYDFRKSFYISYTCIKLL
jgi:hypothetical protein